MKRNLYCKIFAVGIILILVGVNVVLSANSVNTVVEEDVIETAEVEPLDANEEIITKIDGAGYDVVIHSKKGLFSDVTFYAGSWGTWFEIKGWKYPFPTFFNEMAIHIHASCFIGFIREIDYGSHITYVIRGIALGDIEYS